MIVTLDDGRKIELRNLNDGEQLAPQPWRLVGETPASLVDASGNQIAWGWRRTNGSYSLLPLPEIIAEATV